MAKCEYKFPLDDLKTFLAAASLLEGEPPPTYLSHPFLMVNFPANSLNLGVGTSAYLGAAAAVSDKTLLTAAASIMTVEARHSAFLRALFKQLPFPQPFDDPLGPNQVFSLAAPFIAACPALNPPLPFKAFPPLALSDADVAKKGEVKQGDKVKVKADGIDLKAVQDGSVAAAFVTVLGPKFVDAKVVGEKEVEVAVPKEVAGESYLVMVKGKDKVDDSSTVAGPLVMEVSGESQAALGSMS